MTMRMAARQGVSTATSASAIRAATWPIGTAFAARRTSTRARQSTTRRSRATWRRGSRSRSTSTRIAPTGRHRPWRASTARQLSQFNSAWPHAGAPTTNRTHCIVNSDYATQWQVELNNNIRLDTTYYYWPDTWILDRPGMFTGSGIPMRYATSTGQMIDVYQATTQMTDESGQTFPKNIDTLLDNADRTSRVLWCVHCEHAHRLQRATTARRGRLRS